MRSTLGPPLVACLFCLGLSSSARASPSPTDEAVAPADELSADAIVRDGEARDPLHEGEAGTAEETELDAVHEPSERRPRRALRWSDGPRRVPTPRGASMQRAAELGLGTRECASRLLHGRPDERWSRAARGRAPDRLLWPIDEGRWVRGFGFVRTTRPDLIHRGVDISAPIGTVVRAAADGIVAYSDNGLRGYGNLVILVHANGWVTLYAHNARTTVQPGYRVRRGERVALVGTTGITHGPHVHFELWQEGHAVDPSALFDGGPSYVERIGRRAAQRGEVAAPRAVTDADRPEEAPLAPHPDESLPARTDVRSRGERRMQRGTARAVEDDADARPERSTRRGRRGTRRE